MRYRLFALLLLLISSNHAVAVEIEELAWMTGSWQGEMGPVTVEEAWSTPEAGVMTTMIKLTGPEGVNMIELIVIRQEQETLMLHLRQFSPALELRLAQDMRLEEISTSAVRFVGGEDASIKALGYSRTADVLKVELTGSDGSVLAVELDHN